MSFGTAALNLVAGLLFASLSAAAGCSADPAPGPAPGSQAPVAAAPAPASTPTPGDAMKPTSTRETVYLAGGCFWGMEELIRKIPGVLETEAGYTGGTLANPKYDDTHDGKSGHAESVKVVYDPATLPFESLLGFYFRMHDPTTADRQGNDVGSQYRSEIFWTTEAQRDVAVKVKAAVDASGKWKRPVVTAIEKAGPWWPAEDYHQDYLQKNPGGYTCHFYRD